RLNLPPDWPTAAARLPAAVRPRYEPTFPRLQEVIGLLPKGPTYYTAAGTTTPPPRFLVNAAQLALLAALDPGRARMLGLYDRDATAARNTSYDYLVVGGWTAPGSADQAWICFDVARGTPAAVATPDGLRVQARRIGGGLIPDVPSTNQVTAA